MEPNVYRSLKLTGTGTLWNLVRNCLTPSTPDPIYSPCTPAEARRRFFFLFFEGNFVGNLAGILRDFFGPTKGRLKDFGENFGAFFVRKFVAPKTYFVPKFALQTCHPNIPEDASSTS